MLRFHTLKGSPEMVSSFVTAFAWRTYWYYPTDGLLQQMQTQITERPQNQVSAFVLIELALLEV